MWIYNTDTNMWEKSADTLSTSDYNNLKQDLSKTALYSKALSGATYLYTGNTNDVYEPLKYKDNTSWYVDPAASVYNSSTSLPSAGNPINKNTLQEYEDYIYEYGFTLKNSFTPGEGIDEVNFLNVKVATTEQIDVNSSTISVIDGVKLYEGDLVLVKNQTTTVDLAYYVNPASYFEGNYYLVDQYVGSDYYSLTFSSDISYYYYNSENGIYKYTNNLLVKQIISTYSNASNLSVYVTLGSTQSDRQFKLSRKLNGYFPVEGEPFEFLSSHNYLVRHQVDYHDLFENNYYDILKHGTQSLNIDGFTYTIPQRTIYVGDFGSILNLQDTSLSQFVYNVYKDTLKSIVQTTNFYWLCGANGSLLRMSKVDFSITKIYLPDEFNTLNSISFYNDLNGIVVGDYDTIYFTKDGGYNWNKITFNDLINFSYTSVVYYSYNTIYIGGKNGKFVELDYSDATGWSYNVINVVKNLTLTDEYELIDDINKIYYTHFDTWNLTYSTVVNQAAGLGITYSMECLFMVTNNSNIIVYEINRFVTEHEFLYLSFSQSLGDLTSITRQNGTNNMIVSGSQSLMFDINSFDIVSTTSNVINNTSNYTLLVNNYSNNIHDYLGQELLGVGNNTLVYDYNYSTTTLNNIQNINIVPRMLFMEYDMANKLNFFDANYNYRLPNSITFSSIGLTDIRFSSNQFTWLDYLKDVYKTYALNTDTSSGNFLNLNTDFRQGTSVFTFSNASITTNLSDIIGLYPNVASATISRWQGFTPTIPSSSYSVFLYKYMSIFQLPYDFCVPGDILQLSSAEITANVMVNYGLTTSSTPGGVILSSTISNPGSGYHLNDTFTINTGTTLALGKVTGITGGGVTPILGSTVSYAGFSWAVGDTFYLLGGSVTASGIVTAVDATAYYRAISVWIFSGGSGYTVGTTFTFGYSTLGIITSVSYGVVTGITILQDGKFTFDPLYMTFGTTLVSGSGTGLIVKVNTYSYSNGGVLSYNLTNPGSGYIAGNIYNTIRRIGSGNHLRILITSTTGSSTPAGTVTSYTLLSTGYGYSTGVKLTTGVSTSGTNLSINIQSVTPLISSNTYFYAFNDLNQAILNSIKSNSLLTITNLNKFDNSSVLLSNYAKHPVSEGYKLIYDGSNYTVEPIFSNTTSYKSLEATINNYYTASSATYILEYTNSYYQFGYTPNYSLLSYLSSVNSSFTASKKFYSMPEYSGLPGNAGGSFNDNNIYYDSNFNTTYLRNKLVFGNNLKYEYDTLWVNTFVDLTLHTNLGTFTKTQVLITDKYYDTEIGGWALIFNDSIININGFIHYNAYLNTIDIISRNTLSQISQDLEVFNNLNKPITNKFYNRGSNLFPSAGYWYFSFYDNPIKTKINTDSYTKILLSDGDIKKYITSIIYSDANNNLKLNVINTNKIDEAVINNSYIYGTQLALNTSNLSDLFGSSMAFINFTGGTNSSQQLNPSYIGVHTINKLDDNNVTVNTPYLNLTLATDFGILKYNVFDPFFNYEPIDLFDIGDDRMYKIPILINENNFYSLGTTNSIINYSSNPKTFRLVDGLDIDTLSNKYHWILEAEISDAIIGQDSNGLVWYAGVWYSGRWFGGTWYSGTWVSGDWYSGSWYAYKITDKVISVEVGTKSVDNLNSIWYNGRWFDGYWDAGIWQNGRWYGGTWNSGVWYNGIWNLGTWNTGLFAGGIWVQGTWYSGVFNSSNRPSYWIDGKMYSADFQNGMWYNGDFGLSFSAINKFGSSASNSRNATWQGGVWNSGNFYSGENVDSYGTASASLVHKYSIWKTGVFNQGNFYGGIVYNIEFNNGHWYGGVTQDIEVIGVSNPLVANQITLNGIFRFNIGDYIYIINNGNSTPYYNLGNDNNPGKYRIALCEFDLNNNWTILTLDYNFNTLGFTAPYNATASSNVDTGLRLVSIYTNINWDSGVWYNGIFLGGTFLGGIWYNGVFVGDWGI